jgi:hypothetical protein
VNEIEIFPLLTPFCRIKSAHENDGNKSNLKFSPSRVSDSRERRANEMRKIPKLKLLEIS